MADYLDKKIVEMKQTEVPRYGISADGYTCRRGAPTGWMVKLEGEGRWRRLMVWQFSNAGTLFVRMGGVEFVVNGYDLPVGG